MSNPCFVVGCWGESHNIVVSPSGELIFENHPGGSEAVKASLVAGVLGGSEALQGCAHFLLDWREHLYDEDIIFRGVETRAVSPWGTTCLHRAYEKKRKRTRILEHPTAEQARLLSLLNLHTPTKQETRVSLSGPNVVSLSSEGGGTVNVTLAQILALWRRYVITPCGAYRHLLPLAKWESSGIWFHARTKRGAWCVILGEMCRDGTILNLSLRQIGSWRLRER